MGRKKKFQKARKRKNDNMFTNKTHLEKGCMSALLGLISAVSVGVTLYLSYLARGEFGARGGIAVLLALVFSVSGLLLGISAHLKEDNYLLFPRVGIVLNFAVIVWIGFLLYLSV